MQYDQTPLHFPRNRVLSVKNPLKSCVFFFVSTASRNFFPQKKLLVFHRYIRPCSASSSFPSAFFSMRET